MVAFFRALDGFDGKALVLNIGVALLLVGVVNAGIFALAGTTNASTRGGPLIGPVPGPIVGLVWTWLFVILAVAKWRIQVFCDESAARRASKWIVVLILFCAAYPIYTIGLSLSVIGLVGNFATIVMAGWVLILVGRVEPITTLGPLAVIVWVSFASLVIVDQARWLW